MILIVGGAGYIGSHINKLLSEQGYETVIYDNLEYGHQESVKWGNLEIGDLNDVERLEQVFRKYQIDVVFHFAAYAYVGESVKNPSKYYNNNVVNTIRLLDIMRKFGVSYCVFSSTCATYGMSEHMPITEEEAQKPINPYGKSKLMIENILKDYGYAYGIKYCCLRYFNAAGADPDGKIGESHTPETHLIPLVLQATLHEKEIKVFGTDYQTRDGSCIRDYIHVMDLADAHLKAMDYLKNGGESTAFNLGNGTGYSVLEIIAAVEKITGKKINVIYESRREGDPPILIGGAQKAKEVLGWKPKYVEIEQILEHAWNWECNKKY